MSAARGAFIFRRKIRRVDLMLEFSASKCTQTTKRDRGKAITLLTLLRARCSMRNKNVADSL